MTIETIVSKIGFNPTLVRLRAPAPTPTPSPGESFQSHAGSIEGWVVGTRPQGHVEVSIPRWFD